MRNVLLVLLLVVTALMAVAADPEGSGRDDVLRVRGPVRQARVETGMAQWDGEHWSHEARGGSASWFAVFTRDGKPEEIVSLPPVTGPGRAGCREAYRYDRHAREIAYTKSVNTLLTARYLTSYHPQGPIATRDEWSQSLAGLTHTAYQYDLHGNETAARFYGGDGKLLNEELTSYTGDGKPLREQVRDGEGRLLGETRYGYDGQGHEIARKVFNGTRLLEALATRYDAQGREIRRTEYRRPGVPEVIWLTSYPGTERLVEHLLVTNGQYRLLQRTRYDAQGRKIADLSFRYRDDGTPSSRLETYYDAQGHLTLEASYRSSPIPYTRHTCVYDAHGNLLHETEEAWGTPAVERKWDYRYDRHGNWVKRFQREWEHRAGAAAPASHAFTARTIIYQDDPLAVVRVLPDQIAMHPELQPRLWWVLAGVMLGLLALGWGILRRRRQWVSG